MLTDSLKRAPKWAWWTVGGVGIGAASIKLWRDRAAPPPDPATTDPSTEVGATYAPGPGGAPASVIVPPVIIPAQSNDQNAGVGVLQDLYIGAVHDVVTGWNDVYGPIAGLLPSLIPTPDQIMAIANGGGPPTTNVTVMTVPPVPQEAPRPAPAPYEPPAPAPAVIASAAQQTCPHPWGCGADPCTGEYMFYQDQGPRKGQCYKVVTKDGKRYRYYKNGDKVLDS